MKPLRSLYSSQAEYHAVELGACKVSDGNLKVAINRFVHNLARIGAKCVGEALRQEVLAPVRELSAKRIKEDPRINARPEFRGISSWRLACLLVGTEKWKSFDAEEFLGISQDPE